MEMQAYLEKLTELQGSDLYISANAKPMARVEGKISMLSDKTINEDQAIKLVYSILREAQIQEYEKNLELNLALYLPDIGRFRD